MRVGRFLILTLRKVIAVFLKPGWRPSVPCESQPARVQHVHPQGCKYSQSEGKPLQFVVFAQLSVTSVLLMYCNINGGARWSVW